MVSCDAHKKAGKARKDDDKEGGDLEEKLKKIDEHEDQIKKKLEQEKKKEKSIE